ncbi:MAG: ATP-binding cassette domain-containing protein [Bacillota bacterium]|nr:ATP-binding cassette domain-containing protein [Bacillota bacterium]
MIRLQDISYIFSNGYSAINQLNMDIETNEFIAVMGRNGSGKSTLARLISGLLLPTSGSIEVDGYTIDKLQNMQMIRRRVGLLLPSPDNQLIAGTVEQDIAFGPENLCLPSQEIHKRVDAALAMVSMEDYRLDPPNLLSGGQKQLVCIAGLLAMQPQYMVLDELTSMLDPLMKKKIIKTIKELHQSTGISFILITHDLEEAIEADRIVLLEGGSIKVSASPKDLVTDINLLESQGIQPLDISIMTKILNHSPGMNLSPGLKYPKELVDEVCHLRLNK